MTTERDRQAWTRARHVRATARRPELEALRIDGGRMPTVPAPQPPAGPAPAPAPSNRAPGIADQSSGRPFPGPCDHPTYAVRDDSMRGGCFCSLCGARYGDRA